MNAAFEGFYINLDESVDRREAMEVQIRALGLEGIVHRLPALRGDARPAGITRGQLGCFLSHSAALEAWSGQLPLLVLEDDVVLPPFFCSAIAQILANAGDDWDVIFLANQENIHNVYRIHEKVALRRRMEAAGGGTLGLALLQGSAYYAGMAAYLLHPQAREAMSSVHHRLAEAGYPEPQDRYLAREVGLGRVRAKLAFPHPVQVREGVATTIVDRSFSDEMDIHNGMLNLFSAGTSLMAMAERASEEFRRAPFDPAAYIAASLIYAKLRR